MPVAQVTIQNRVGLHARPASLFVSEAKKHSCKITVESNGRAANAKNIISVLALGAQKGQVITITTEGEGADEALSSLVELVNNLAEDPK
jgi:phosphocarrier protein